MTFGFGSPSYRKSFSIDQRDIGDVTILDIHGGILIGENDDAVRETVTKLADAGRTKVLLNLADVPYMDGVGVSELVRCYTTVARKDGKMKLLHPSGKLRKLLTETRLLKVFEIYYNEHEAMESFA